MEPAALEAGGCAEQQRQVWCDREGNQLPPAGVLSHHDGDR
jgi:hypothetical protein